MSEMQEVFQKIYDTRFWQGDSVSGPGSDLEATEFLRELLPTVFAQWGITSVLDISCGDHFWGRFMLWPKTYIGADIVPEIIEKNREAFDNLDWRVLDATKDPLPKVDLIFCRDTLVHFDNQSIDLALKNFRASGSKYLLTTTFPGVANPNQNIQTGDWHTIDLEHYKYALGRPIEVFREYSTPADHEFSVKSLGLWRLN